MRLHVSFEDICASGSEPITFKEARRVKNPADM
jgi:hypothetical protein